MNTPDKDTDMLLGIIENQRMAMETMVTRMKTIMKRVSEINAKIMELKEDSNVE